MTATTPTGTKGGRDTHHGGAVGVIAFAGIMMMLLGVLQALQGLAALVNDTFFVVGEEYVFELDLTTWGWIHLLLGLTVALAGLALLRGSTWGRVVAVVLASLSVIANFLWLPYYPLWAVLVIAVDILVIWAVTAHGQEMTRL